MLIVGYLGMLAVMFIGLTLAHGTPQEIWSGEGFIMAFGGAVIGTIAGLSSQELKDAIGCLKVAFLVRVYDYEKLITDFVNYAGISRKDGLLGLEKVVSHISDGFMSRAVQMAIDGVEPDLVEERLAVEMASMDERHARTWQTDDTPAAYAP